MKTDLGAGQGLSRPGHAFFLSARAGGVNDQGMAEDRNLTRRGFFSLLRRPFATEQPVPLPPAAEGRVLRPPSALPEALFADVCVRCGACEAICPRQAIRPLPDSAGERLRGTPHIVAREAPCALCTGLRCTTVCPSGALHPLTEIGAVHMGLASVDAGRCLPYLGSACDLCYQKCPVPDAISVDDQGRPQVGGACVGCGLCEYYCPTEPAAIRVRSAASLEAGP